MDHNGEEHLDLSTSPLESIKKRKNETISPKKTKGEQKYEKKNK